MVASKSAITSAAKTGPKRKRSKKKECNVECNINAIYKLVGMFTIVCLVLDKRGWAQQMLCAFASGVATGHVKPGNGEMVHDSFATDRVEALRDLLDTAHSEYDILHWYN